MGYPWDSDFLDYSGLFDDIIIKDLYHSSPLSNLGPQTSTHDDAASENLASADTGDADTPDSPSPQPSMAVPVSPPPKPVLSRSPYMTWSKKGAAASSLEHADGPKSVDDDTHDPGRDVQLDEKRRKIAAR
jgi:hypothetical protein